ncbi:ABC transporter substrate-binding protein [Taklimakanibacter deserti]|uniref:ABC transporter substrate-binding protein n=1 Tax=Taklimakanibacter deserti TaxID=2267839 RepID=UPI0013C529F4
MTGNSKGFVLSKRRLLAYGAGLAGFAASGWAGALADTIDNAEKTGAGPKVKIEKKKGPYRIGFSNGFSGNSWRAMCIRALELEAKAQSDVADLIIVDGQNDITKQVGDIESLVSQQVDAILVIANSGTAVVPAIRAAMQEGIVTVPFNLPIEGEDYHAYCGTDPSRKGKSSGTWLKDALGGTGKIVALGGLPGNSYTAAGWKGAQEAFAGSDIEVLAFKDTDWSEDKAKVVMSDLIAAYPQIDGIWADGGQVTSGASKALLAAGRPLIPVTGDDYNGLLKLYDSDKGKQPKFDIGLISEPTWESVVALRMALALLRGEEIQKQLIITPKLITKDNYKDYMRPDLPDAVFTDTNLPDDELKKIFS